MGFFSLCSKVSYTLIPTKRNKEKIFYMQPVIHHQNSIIHRSITECFVLTLACLQQSTEHTSPPIHKSTALHDVIFLLTSNTHLIPTLLEVLLFFKDSSKGSPHPKGKTKKPTKTNTQNYNKRTCKGT